MALPSRINALLEREFVKFVLVGGVSFLIDVVGFNLLLLATGAPLLSKLTSALVATTNAFVLNRSWTFASRTRGPLLRDYLGFLALNGVGISIALLCLWVSHHLLGFTSTLADNIAANLVGMALGSLFRFWSYRRFLWRLLPPEPAPADARSTKQGPPGVAGPVRSNDAQRSTPRA